MARMRAIDAAVLVLEREGISCAFGVPGAAINPLYSALKARGTIRHILARHVEAASHMAEGFTRAKAGNIGLCIGTSGPAGTDMITGLYSASADSIPILCITGQAPRARLTKEDFQAVDIAAIAAPVSEMGGHRHGALPGADGAAEGVPPDALGPARAGADRPAGRRPARRDRVRHRRLRAAGAVQAEDEPQAGREGARHAQRGRAAADRRRRRHHQRRRLGPADRIRRDHRRAGRPDADGLGHDPRRPSADGRHVRPADLAPLRQRDDARLRLRARRRQPLGEPPHRLGRQIHGRPEIHPYRHRADADRPRLRAGPRRRLGCGRGAEDAARRRHRMEGGGQAARLVGLGEGMPAAQEDHEAQDAFRPDAAETAARL